MKTYRNKIGKRLNAFLSGSIRLKGLLFGHFKSTTDHFKLRTATASRLIPDVVRKPAVTWRWLLVSPWFYAAVGVTLILMHTVVPIAIDTALSKIYPQIRSKQLFGLIEKKSDDPRIAQQRKIVLVAGWTGAVGLNAYVLLLCLPGVVRRADAKARQCESRADTMVEVKPSESILLYNHALKFAVDQSYESNLHRKINNLDSAIKSGSAIPSPAGSPGAPARKGSGTIALTMNERPDRSQYADAIGPDGRYRIERTLGTGAMGVVFLAKDQVLLRDVALKKLTPGMNQNQNVIARFQQEARALAQLSHPNIVQVYDFVRHDGQYWIAMEYVPGHDLGSLIEDRGAIPLEESLELCARIANAMAYAHNRGVIHRDFKPSNVLVAHDGDPKVMDFGLAKLSQSSIATMEGSLLGSPAFMSPEQARGDAIDARSDIYAMGVTLYQLVTGRLPFEGDLKTLIAQKIAGHQPSMEHLEKQVPEDLALIIKKMMEADPDNRPATMKAVGQALDSICRTEV